MKLNRRFDLWMPAYLAGAARRAAARRTRRDRLTHILFYVCDHFEPRHGAKEAEQPQRRVATWHAEYARMQREVHAAYGKTPLHTFFYPPHHGVEHLPRLAEMAHDGLGEIELHYHHHGDSPDTLRQALRSTLDSYHEHGLLLAEGSPPKAGFGFVHGDWALNNSCGGRYCGVNDEVTILQDLGCWADFTMPSGNQCQTRKINSIYYGVGDPDRPKAHDDGPDARVGAAVPRGLLMMQGPLAINWSAPGHPRPENASLTTNNWGRPDRVPVWLDANIHVRGRPEWLFVKLHTHGAIEQDFDGLFGERARALHRLLNEQYNDGTKYRLHYVTARQAYNIAKAAEAGLNGDPSAYFDYVVAPPVTRHYALDRPHTLEAATTSSLILRSVRPHASDGASLRCRVGPFSRLTGPLAGLDIDVEQGRIRLESSVPGARFRLNGPQQALNAPVDGGRWLGDFHEGLRELHLDGHQCTISLPNVPAAQARATLAGRA